MCEVIHLTATLILMSGKSNFENTGELDIEPVEMQKCIEDGKLYHDAARNLEGVVHW